MKKEKTVFHLTKLNRYIPVHSFLKAWNYNELRTGKFRTICLACTILNYSEIGLYRCPFKFGLEMKFGLEWNNSIMCTYKVKPMWRQSPLLQFQIHPYPSRCVLTTFKNAYSNTYWFTSTTAGDYATNVLLWHPLPPPA